MTRKQEFKAPLTIIFVNIYFFILIHFTSQSEEFIRSLILFPEHLKSGRFLCVITSGFIHYDLRHLFLNMLGVVAFGRVVERHLGALKTLFIYFGSLAISLLFAGIIHLYFLNNNIAIIGASGAVMGLLATAMLLDPYVVTYEMIFPIPVMIKGWMYLYADIQGLLNPQPDGISHLAHMFGFLSIALLIYFLSKKERKILKEGLIINLFSIMMFFIAWLVVYHLKNR